MTVLQWDQVGDRLYETGVDHGVLYQLDAEGDYVDGVPWNGLTTVTESPSGAEANKQYADNIVYVNLISAEEFGGTIEAFTYPDEFGQWTGGWSAGTASLRSGLPHASGQRHRRSGVWLQAAPDLRCSGLSVGEGLRHDQRLARGHRVLVGVHHHTGSGHRTQADVSAHRRLVHLRSG
jgi:hypothetical protein